MDRALIVSGTEKGRDFFSEKLLSASFTQLVSAKSGSEARRTLLERDFDLVIINAPLKDESGEELAQHIAASSISQVILVVKSEHFEAISAVCEDSGVLTISKPVNKELFWVTLKLAIATQNRLQRMHNENSKLKQQIEDIRIINRAKSLLISNLKLSEKDAHKAIEKQAMDLRVSKREVAEMVLRRAI